MSFTPTISRAAPASGPWISESLIVTSWACWSPTPGPCPLTTIRTSSIVTWDAATLTLWGMYRPLSTAPLPSTCTQPRGSKCQPGPLEIWPGTDRSTTPAGTPVVAASGNPHGCRPSRHPPGAGADPGTGPGANPVVRWGRRAIVNRAAARAKARATATPSPIRRAFTGFWFLWGRVSWILAVASGRPGCSWRSFRGGRCDIGSPVGCSMSHRLLPAGVRLGVVAGGAPGLAAAAMSGDGRIPAQGGDSGPVHRCGGASLHVHGEVRDDVQGRGQRSSRFLRDGLRARRIVLERRCVGWLSRVLRLARRLPAHCGRSRDGPGRGHEVRHDGLDQRRR